MAGCAGEPVAVRTELQIHDMLLRVKPILPLLGTCLPEFFRIAGGQPFDQSINSDGTQNRLQDRAIIHDSTDTEKAD